MVERIGELKRSLSSQFGSSLAYVRGDGAFVVKMSDFFATRITSNASDFAILRGVIAETEGRDVNSVTVLVEGMGKADTGALPNEFEGIFS